MSKVVLGAFAALAACVLGACKANPAPASTPSEADNAARYIVYEHARVLSTSVRSDCSGACDDGGAIEVTIGLLGVGGEATTGSLLNLLALQLDAGAAEARSCQIAKRGKSIVPALEHLDANQSAAWCQTTFADLKKRELSDVADVSASQTCRPANEIEGDRREWIEALNSGRDLFAESGPC